MDRETLTQQWLTLRHTWPSDGWDGAAVARAEHDRKVREVAGLLAEIHAVEGHGPIGDFGVRQQSCICTKPVDTISDERVLDRYGHWVT